MNHEIKTISSPASLEATKGIFKYAGNCPGVEKTLDSNGIYLAPGNYALSELILN